MDTFREKVAIVTGGASGIGRALCEELARRGARVVVADIRGEEVRSVATAIPGASAETLDVTQPEAVRQLVDRIAAKHQRLDFMFNNAGIGIGGEVLDMTPDHWRRIVDVNLWGVVYGTVNAYRVMARQGFGHIVNTASLAGLVPVPGVTAYAMTKHAVVGLSTSLRTEGAALGVRVSVVCPGFIRTPIYDAVERVTKLDEAAFQRRVAAVPKLDSAKCARVILRGVARNRAIITVTALARIVWWLYRLHPALLSPVCRWGMRDLRSMARSASGR